MAIRTGIAVDAVDVDGEDGLRALSAAMPSAPSPELGEFLVGPTVLTGRETGFHVYVQSTGFGNKDSRTFVPHCDYRGRGGYVIAPPSLHETGKRYRFYLPGDPDYGPDAPVVPAPAWLLEALKRTEPAPATGEFPKPVAENRYGQRALEAEVARVALAPQGQRNNTLNNAALALGGLVSGGVLSLAEVADALLLAGVRAGLGETEALRTINSGMAAGIRSPRQPKERRQWAAGTT